MGKLFKLKKWMTVADAAVRLTDTFGESVREEDVYRFALDGHLPLSVVFVNAVKSRFCRPVQSKEIDWMDMPSLDGVKVVRVPVQGRILKVGEGLFLVEDGNCPLEGLWDLPLIGGERIDVEFECQRVSGGPEVTAVSLEGVFVSSSDGAIFEIQDDDHPAGALPDDCIFVVRTEALLQFEQSMNGDETSKEEKPLQTKERRSLLVVIAALAKEAGINIEQPSKAATIIEGMTVQMGAYVAKRTIEEHLKKIPDALEARSK